jgi:hypothetical protein
VVRVAVAGLPESVALPSTVVPAEKVTVPSLEVGVGSTWGVVTIAVRVSLCPQTRAVLATLTEMDVGVTENRVRSSMASRRGRQRSVGGTS